MGGGEFYTLTVDEDGRVFSTLLGPAWGGDFNAVRKDLPLVLLSGEQDPNARPLLRASYEGLTLDGFKHVTFLQVPSFGHAHPQQSWFEKGIFALEKSKQRGIPATTTSTTTTTRPQVRRDELLQAKRLLMTARLQASRDRREEARAYLERVVKEYSNTPSAEPARRMLEDAGSATTRPKK